MRPSRETQGAVPMQPTARPPKPPPARRTPRWPLALAALAALALLLSSAPALATGSEDDEPCAVTPGGWGSPPNGGNPGQLLHDHFDEIFGDELVVGDLVFEDAQDVTDALPYTGPGSAFKNHAVALAINIAFGDAGLLSGTISDVRSESTDPAYDNKTAAEILAMAEQVLIDTALDKDLNGHPLIDVMTRFNDENDEGFFGCHEPPECPTDLTAVPQADGSILLSWNAVDDAVSYDVYRGTGADGDLIFLDETTDTTYSDETTAVGQLYRYRVTAFDGVLESRGCEVVAATAIPFFPGLAVGAAAVIASVGAFAWMRRKA